MLSPGCNCPPMPVTKRLSSAFCTIGARLFMSVDVSKMSRKRFSTSRSPPGWARAAGINIIPANSTAEIRVHKPDPPECFLLPIEIDSERPVKAVPLRSVVILQLVPQFSQRISDHEDKIFTARRQPAESAHHIPFDAVVGHDENLAVVLKPVCRPLDHVVRRLAGLRKQNFHGAA